MTEKAGESRPRRGQKVYSIIQSNIPRNSIDKDTHHKRTGQMGAVKYLGESYYQNIE